MLWRMGMFIALFTLGCGRGYQATTAANSTALAAPVDQGVAEPPTPHMEAAGNQPATGFCSKLDFADLSWPATVQSQHHEALALALNISGSFEGHNGWQNLTNNFDGQGLSYGLLNQCLGQGSLQPLLIKMRDRYPEQLGSTVEASRKGSLLGMLKQWESFTGVAGLPELSDYGLSALDEPEDVRQIVGYDPAEVFHIQLLRKNQLSVDWAVSTLYNGSSFKPNWKTELKALAQTPGYRSLQVEAATRIHLSALRLFKHFQLNELRSYLFFFDIVVQNGGLPDSDIQYLDARFRANPSLSETTKLNEILTRRLTHVKAIYREDVRSRKKSLINGTGVVHGGNRNYAKEFCANLRSKVPQN